MICASRRTIWMNILNTFDLMRLLVMWKLIAWARRFIYQPVCVICHSIRVRVVVLAGIISPVIWAMHAGPIRVVGVGSWIWGTRRKMISACFQESVVIHSHYFLHLYNLQHCLFSTTLLSASDFFGFQWISICLFREVSWGFIKISKLTHCI